MNETESIIGTIEKADLKGSGKTNGKVWKRWEVYINDEKFGAFGEWDKLVGEEGEWQWKWNTYTDKLGVERQSKQLIEPFKATPRTMDKTISESQILQRMDKRIEDIWNYVKQRK